DPAAANRRRAPSARLRSACALAVIRRGSFDPPEGRALGFPEQSLQRGAGAEQSRHDGPDGNILDLRNLLVREALKRHEQQRLTLLRRQQGERTLDRCSGERIVAWVSVRLVEKRLGRRSCAHGAKAVAIEIGEDGEGPGPDRAASPQVLAIKRPGEAVL